MRLPYDSVSSRRTLLKSAAALASGSAFPILGQLPPPENHHSPVPPTKAEAKAYRWVYFRSDELSTLDALTETIIPADDHSPGAQAARVAEYIDTMIADAPEPAKQLWRSGLASANELALADCGKAFSQCTAPQQHKIMTRLAGPDEDLPFFAALKRMTIDGYYTSRIGIHQDLQYQGNAVLTEFPGCTDEHTH